MCVDGEAAEGWSGERPYAERGVTLAWNACAELAERKPIPTVRSQLSRRKTRPTKKLNRANDYTTIVGQARKNVGGALLVRATKCSEGG